MYPYTSVESQMRQLADLAFLLRQYEFAVSMYRLAAQDYLAAPNNKWYAGAEVRWPCVLTWLGLSTWVLNVCQVGIRS